MPSPEMWYSIAGFTGCIISAYTFACPFLYRHEVIAKKQRRIILQLTLGLALVFIGAIKLP
jgi:hypothetical protein